MLKPWVANALARAFLGGEAAPDAIVERAGKALGQQWRWLRPLAARYLKAARGIPRLRYRDVIQFLKADEGFCKALWKHRRKLAVKVWLAAPQRMRPVAAANNWDLPHIETVAGLADWLDIGIAELEWFADLRDLSSKKSSPRLRHYWYRVLQKDLAAVRLIEAPKSRLKVLQRRILDEILELVPVHGAVHGFRKGRSIQTFCTPHVGQRVVVRMDLQDFFPSISGARIQSLFRTIGYPESVADLLGGLCTTAAPQGLWKSAPWNIRMLYARPHLPQGAPTSPALANLCAYHVDCRLRGLAEACDAAYSRYADDIAFSGGEVFARSAERLSVQAAAILVEEGFEVHHRKTRIMRRSVRQHLAGIVVNERLNFRRADFDRLKATLTNCIRSGPASQNTLAHPRFRAHLQGRIAFMASLNPAKATKLERLFDQIKWDV